MLRKKVNEQKANCDLSLSRLEFDQKLIKF